MDHSSPMRPSAFKPIGHYPHDSVITLSNPVIARPKPLPQPVRKEDQYNTTKLSLLQRSRSRSNSARRRTSHVNPANGQLPGATGGNVNGNGNGGGGHGNAFRVFFRNRTRSISPTKFNAQKSVRRMRTEKGMGLNANRGPTRRAISASTIYSRRPTLNG